MYHTCRAFSVVVALSPVRPSVECRQVLSRIPARIIHSVVMAQLKKKPILRHKEKRKDFEFGEHIDNKKLVNLMLLAAGQNSI